MTHYLDHNACTPVDPRVLARFLEVERSCPANPGSLHQSGRYARGVLEAARSDVANALDIDERDVFFVSGGTEANNLAVLGSGDAALPALLASVEHPSVHTAAERRGVEYWPVDAEGRAVIGPPLRSVGLLCLVHGQSEVGTLQPIDAAAELAEELGAPFHVDAAQTLGRMSLAGVLRVADTVSLSAHKAGGLRGASVLVARNAGADLRPLLFGGAQEGGMRPGTTSPALAAATALTIELAVRETTQRARTMATARDVFLETLEASGVALRLITPLANSLPNTIMLLFPHLDGRLLLPALDVAGVECSQGSACSSGSPLPPRMLLSMGLDDTLARCCVRFSFAAHHDRDAAIDAAKSTASVVHQLQQHKK